MSYGFNSMQLTPPQATEWAREATAAYDRSLAAPSAFEASMPSRKARLYDVRKMHGKVWKRATTPRGRS